MQFWKLLSSVLFIAPLFAQTVCGPTPAYSRCEVVFELNDAEAAAHPNPYRSVQMKGEFRSPRYQTALIHAFWDGGRRMVMRMAPTEPGEWEVRVTGNIERFNNKLLKITATQSDAPGFIKAANVHHWQYTEGLKPHLWMGDTNYNFAMMPMDAVRQYVDQRAQQKFSHVIGFATGDENGLKKAFPTPDRPDPAFFQQLDQRIAYLNSKGLIFDMILGHARNQLTTHFPTWQQRQAYVQYLVSRYSAFNLTWLLVQDFETYDNPKAITRELGMLLKNNDPYQHPRSTGTLATTSALAEEGWMDYIAVRSADDQLGAIEHQVYPRPFVNLDVTYGRAAHDPASVRRRLWNSAMDGQYPCLGPNDSAAVGQATIWFDFFSDSRHWELEPFFDLDEGRAVTLEGVEYIVYVEKPSAPLEVRIERHGYDVSWFDPATGQSTKLKNYKGEKFAAEPPDRDHDWVLYLSREGKKESMANSYKFESRRILMQEIETGGPKFPFEIALPSGDASLSSPGKYEAKLKRETRATRSMMYLWTGEVTAGGKGSRVVGTGREGTLQIPKDVTKQVPAVFNLHVWGMNANGKVYSQDKIVTLKP